MTLDVLPLNNVSVSGTLPIDEHKLGIRADRDQPFSIGGGGWVGTDLWRLYMDYTTGSDNILRIGARITL